jgi:hypothetical protein
VARAALAVGCERSHWITSDAPRLAGNAPLVHAALASGAYRAPHTRIAPRSHAA